MTFKPLTRDQLAKFLPDQEAIRRFEQLFVQAGELTPGEVAALTILISEVSVDAGIAQETANRVSDSLARIAYSLEILASVPQYVPPAPEDFIIPPSAGGSVTSIDVSGGTTGMSFSGGPITTSGTITMSGILDRANGGLGTTSTTAGRLLIGNGGSAITDDADLSFDTGTNALTIGAASIVGKVYPATDAGASQTAAGLCAGTGAPNNANGADGDLYFRSDGGALTTIYQRRAGAWVGVIGSGTRTIGMTFDGGGSPPMVGAVGYVVAQFSGTIDQWSIIADASGSAVVDVWKAAGAIPTVANTIAGSEKPTLSATQLNSDTSLSSWTTAVTVGDVFGFNIDSVTTCTRLTVEVRVQAS